MLEIGSNVGEYVATTKKVKLVESAQVLEIILPYIYPGEVPPLELWLSNHFLVIRALHKYEVSIRADVEALRLRRLILLC